MGHLAHEEMRFQRGRGLILMSPGVVGSVLSFGPFGKPEDGQTRVPTRCYGRHGVLRGRGPSFQRLRPAEKHRRDISFSLEVAEYTT